MTLTRVDIDLKREQRWWEPWKMLVAAFTAGAAVMGTLVAIMALIFRHFA